MLIRNLSLEEVRAAVRWADREGWEPGLGDAEPFFAADVRQPNADAVSLLEAHGMERSFETARIYRGPAPELPLGRIFGITSLELG